MTISRKFALMLTALFAFSVCITEDGWCRGGKSSFGGGSSSGSRSSSSGSRSSFGGNSRSSFGGSNRSSSSSSSSSRSSGFGSSGSSSRSSWGSSSSSSSRATKPSATTQASRSTSWGTSKPLFGGSTSVQENAPVRPVAKPKLSDTDRTLIERANISGTSFASRNEAETAFKQKFSNTYKSFYDAPPQSRPEHIPASTTIGGASYTIEYRPDLRGYGYYIGGRWMLYDALSDALWMNALMNRYNYYYGPPVVPVAEAPIVTSGSGKGGVVLVICVAVVLGIIAVAFFIVIMNSQTKSAPTVSREQPRARKAQASPMPASPKREMKAYDPYDAKFWLSIKPKSTVILKDEQAIEDARKEGKGMNGYDYSVGAVRVITEMNNLARWVLLKLDGSDQEIWLMAKIVDEKFDLRVYFHDEGFEPGTRAELIEHGCQWLFSEPQKENWKPRDLKFTHEITQKPEGEDREVVYVQKSQEMYGHSSESPKPSGLPDKVLATIVEYSTQDTTDNPELLVVELGGEGKNEGGHITLWLGSQVNPNEVEVVRA